MSLRREVARFLPLLGVVLAAMFGESLIGGRVLSPADALFVSASFRDVKGPEYEPSNRLLLDPVLQFEPWVAFNRQMIRAGRLPLWNPYAGCGTPHLANAQSAPFDPFQGLAYVGTVPEAFAAIAWSRLMVAGLGMFVLARSWGLGVWGRWFAGLTFPLCGFLMVWLLYPVTAAAIWLPWLFLATDRVLERRDAPRLGMLGLTVGVTLLGGHIQTSAHVLLATGLYAVWRAHASGRFWALPRWGLGVANGLLIGAVTVLPLAAYLRESPVWEDRRREAVSPMAITRPRLLDTVCTAVPYAFGSQRRGHPNLARAFGVHNLNESAGGYAGLATLLWLAPQAWRARRGFPRVDFLVGLTAFGFLGAFGFPPVANLLRALPVLDVTDQRRLSLWVAFGLVLLGGIGLDHLGERWPRTIARTWVGVWVASATALVLVALLVPAAESRLRARAEAHYAHAAESTDGADPDLYRVRAERQVRATLEFVPKILVATAAELALFATLAALTAREMVGPSLAKATLLGVTVLELFAFGYGLNPAIDKRDNRPETEVVRAVRERVGKSGRVLGLGEEWPPNVAMRYGLSDVRNYDSVEMLRSLDWLTPLYESRGDLQARTSRRDVTWAGVIRARERLYEAGVSAIIAATPPPASLAEKAERVGSVWVVGLDAAPRVGLESGRALTPTVSEPGRYEIEVDLDRDDTLIVRETYDHGWRGEVDGGPIGVRPYKGTFLAVGLKAGRRRVRLVYDPAEVRWGVGVSLAGLAAAVGLLVGPRAKRAGRFLARGLGRLRTFGLESNFNLHRTSRPVHHRGMKR